MSQARATTERLNAFCDGVFAVLITVLVLDLRPPELPTFHALLMRWPTWLSYAVSYIFIAIVWANHHYILLIRELIDGATVRRVSAEMRRSMRVRSITTLCLFGTAAVIALRYPVLGLAVCCGCLIAYLKPDAPGLRTEA